MRAMKAFRAYSVSPYLPEPLEPLREMAYDLWWAWHPEGIELVRRVDPEAWDASGHNPAGMLGRVSQERLEALAADESFLDHLQLVVEAAKDYHTYTPWFARAHPDLLERRIAYFSIEYGLDESVPIYSGGLGILAGDHVKSASDLGVPIVAVGLLYQEGYFRQYLNPDGWQQEEYPDNDFQCLPVRSARGPDGAQLRVTVNCAGAPVLANVWTINVGRVRLLLLDTNVPENPDSERVITAQLYGGDLDMRIRQEIVLGIGGVRALDALGVRPSVFHMNDGHCAFLGLERVRKAMQEDGLSFGESIEATASSNVFTTHTPVPAGHDRFPAALMDRHFRGFYSQLGLSAEQFLALGRQNRWDPNEDFCMTVLAIRLSRWRNGVSKLHGRVSRRMWTGLWPGVPEDEVPLTSITNGIHTPSWISHDMAGLFDRYLGPQWRQQPAEERLWKRVNDIPDTELWRTHERRRERLVGMARRRLRTQLEQRGVGRAEIDLADEALDPEGLTIGFGRRFATYKRATLLLRDPERLVRLLTDREKPVQLILAGKAHPADSPAKELIRQIVHFAREPEVRDRMVFIENYDLSIAHYLVQGADVWLNTPRRPLEASGTSGMKATPNGALNLSVLDGWWAEAYTQETGWAIGRGEEYRDPEYQDEVESHTLFDLLEQEVVPLFYRRGGDRMPRAWIAKMKTAMRVVGPQFSSHRMLSEYVETCYVPAMRRQDMLTADGMVRAKALAAWIQRVVGAWPQVRVQHVADDYRTGAEVGGIIQVQALVALGSLEPGDVRVELYAGSVDAAGEITSPETVAMHYASAGPDGTHEFRGEIGCRAAGLRGYTVRVLPAHRDLPSPFDMGLVVWAG